MSWTGQRVVITGASQGLGRALAVRLARGGARLALGARRLAALEATRAACPAEADVLLVPTDVTLEGDCAALVARAAEAFGGVDVLVCNVGINMNARADAVTSPALFERMMDVNFHSVVRCVHHALPHLEASRGRIAAISSLAGFFGVPGQSGYSASKHALEGYCDALRIELRPRGVSVLVASLAEMNTGLPRQALGPDGAPILLDTRARDVRNAALPVEEVAAEITRGLERRARQLVLPRRAGAARLARLFAPGLVDRIVERRVRWLETAQSLPPEESAGEGGRSG
jgi:NAD(P)-dependent dehydrogenase (short-subunit alcohol dehydrogenase family)